VMDRDTVASLLDPFVRDAGRRRATAAWIRGLPRALAVGWGAGGELAAVWGERDRIYPISQLEVLDRGGLLRGRRVIAGGRFLHLEEQPWAFADALVELLAERPGAAP